MLGAFLGDPLTLISKKKNSKMKTTLSTLLVLSLTGCSFFTAPNVKPAADAVQAQRELFLDLSDAFRSLVNGSNATAEVKSKLLAEIQILDGKSDALFRSTMNYLTELGKFSGEDWSNAYNRLLDLYNKTRTK